MEIITVGELREAAGAMRGVASRARSWAPDIAAEKFAIARKLEGLADQMGHYGLCGITVMHGFRRGERCPDCCGTGCSQVTASMVRDGLPAQMCIQCGGAGYLP